MNFLNPWAFLALLSVPLLVLLYFLKLKRPQVRVASTLLWQKVIEDMRVNSPFQKLRRSLLLILQVLALLAVIAGLARPLAMVRDTTNESIVVLLDNSASMGAVEQDGRTRLEIAADEIGRMAEGMARGDEMMLIGFNQRARTLCGFTQDRRAVKDALAGVRPTDCPTAIEPALVLAKSIAGSRSHPRVLVFSDGRFQSSSGVELPVKVEYRKIGTTRPNIAITGLDIRRSLGDRNKIEMFVAVENFSKETIAGNMAVRLDGRMLDTKYFSVGAEQTLSQIFEAILPGSGNVQVDFDAKDALTCDNHAWKVVTPPVFHKVLVVGDQSFFVERVLKASPGVDFKSITAGAYNGESAAGCTMVIWNSVKKPSIAPCDNLYFGCFPEVKGLVPGDKIEAPDIMDWDNTHPVNRFIDFDNLVLESATGMKVPDSASVLVRSSRSPLITVFPAGGAMACVVAFDPMKSNWPLLVSFPLFLNNCMAWCREQQAGKVESNIPVGRTITVDAEGDPVIVLPGGERQAMQKSPGGGYSFNGVDRCGMYTVEAPGREALGIAANLFDAGESSLEPVDEPVIAGKAVSKVAAGRQVNQEYWKYLVMIVAGIMLLEWIVYHRRWLI